MDRSTQEILKAHQKYLMGKEGQKLVWELLSEKEKINLSYANLSNADLSYANLRNADLRDANLSNADLSNTDLSYADLSNANLSYANLSNANLSYANLSNARNLLDPNTFLANNFEWTPEGIIVYKSFGENFAPNPDWEIKKGSIIDEVVNPLPTLLCACGVNVGTLEWCMENCSKQIWECLIRFPWLASVVVPYNTDGKIRCSKVELLEPLV